MIGIIGGYGEVGLQAARVINKWGKFKIKIGGRNVNVAKLKLSKEFKEALWQEIDINNKDSIEKFIKNCKLVINCVGPSCNISAMVAKKCFEHSCHYVDAGFNEELKNIELINEGVKAIYASGSIPGLSGILPRWLATKFDKVDSLVSYTGILEKFNSSAAEDYLDGAIKNNFPLAGWKNGEICSSILKRKTEVELPYFSNKVNLYPYFDKETEVVAKHLHLVNGEWYMAFEGNYIQAALDKVCFEFLSDKKLAIKHLCEVTALDCMENGSYIKFLIQISGKKDKSKTTKTLILQEQKPSVLTGTIVAVATMCILENEIEDGIYSLSEILNMERFMDRLIDIKEFKNFNIKDCSIDDLLKTVEGEI